MHKYMEFLYNINQILQQLKRREQGSYLYIG